MNEKEALFLVSRIASQSPSFEEAIQKIGVLMERELGGKGLIVGPRGRLRRDRVGR